MTSFKNLALGSLITGFILLAVGLQVVSELLPEVIGGLNNVAAEDVPLNTFFTGSSGVVILAIMAALVLMVLGAIGLVKYKAR